MSVWKVDVDTGDRVRENGRFVRIEGLDEIVQGVRIRLRLKRGEVFLAVLAGPRYTGLIFEKGTPTSRIEGELADEILKVPGIVSVERVTATADYAARTAEVVVECTADLADQRARVRIDDRFSLVKEAA